MKEPGRKAGLFSLHLRLDLNFCSLPMRRLSFRAGMSASVPPPCWSFLKLAKLPETGHSPRRSTSEIQADRMKTPI